MNIMNETLEGLKGLKAYILNNYYIHPVYADVIKDLYKNDCHCSAYYFTKLVEKEKELFFKHALHFRVLTEQKMLTAIIDNVKLAEKSSKVPCCEGLTACCSYLYQVLVVLQPHSYKFDWLVFELYAIFVSIAEQNAINNTSLSPESAAIKARIYCGYAMYLAKKPNEFENCIDCFIKSLDLCRRQPWSAGELLDAKNVYGSLHEFVAFKLAETYAMYAQALSTTDTALALGLSQKAIATTAEAALYEIYLIKIRMLIELKHYKEALWNIAQTESQLSDNFSSDLVRINCELFLHKGECYLLRNEPKKAQFILEQAIVSINKHKLKEIEGRALLLLGKVYMQFADGQEKAREFLMQAKVALLRLSEENRKPSVISSLAQKKAINVDTFIKILKEENPNNYYTLRKLKDEQKLLLKKKNHTLTQI